MKRLTVLVDMDDTIESLLSAWVERLNRSFGTDVKTDEVSEWDISKSFPTLTKEQVYFPLLCDDFWYSVMPIDGASDALQQLIADGHRVLIVTTSAYQTLRTKMDVVLFGYFPFLTWNDVIITSHKQLVKGDVLVDDGVHNLEGGDYMKVLMDAPHNRGYDAEANDMIRVKSWGEAYSVITDLANTIEQIEEEVDRVV